MNILLVCNAGMSTSLLVTKMQEAAKAKGIEGKIWAVPVDTVEANIDQAHVLLLGPQVRYLLDQMKELGAGKGIPVAAIETVNYGMMNGAAVIEQAINLVNNQ